MKNQIIGRSQANQPVRNKELAKILEHVAVADDGTVQVGKDLEVDGAIKIETEPTADNEAANKKYVDSKAGKKLYRHRINVTYGGADDFNFDVIDANPTAYTAATFSQSANAIGRLPVTGECAGNAGTAAIITKAESSAVQIKFTGYQYYDDSWVYVTSTLTWVQIATSGSFSDVVTEL